MVAVISGNGLGLLGTSASVLGPGGQSGLGQSGVAQYVNVATGNLILTNQDEQLVAQGLLARVVRTYNSLGSAGDIGGGAWLLGLDRHVGNLTGSLGQTGSTVTRTGGDGEEELFTYDQVRGLYVGTTSAGAHDTLAWDANAQSWTYVDGSSQVHEAYDAAGILRTLQDPTTGTTFSLEYHTDTHQLVSVLDGLGEGLLIGYDPEGRVATLSTCEIPPGGNSAQVIGRVTYGYDALNRLTDVLTDLTPSDGADTQNFSTHYTYDGDSLRLASLEQGDGIAVAYTYAQDAQGAWRIASVTLGTGAAAQRQDFSYDLQARTTTVADASGRAWTYAYDAQDWLTSVTSPAVNGQRQVTAYGYTADGHLASVTDALGRTTIYRYDTHGNRVLERDADGHTVTATYSATDRLLTRTVYQVADPEGTDAADAGAPGAPSTTRYVYDASDRLRYSIDPVGGVQAREYDAQGRLVKERTYPATAYDLGGVALEGALTLGQLDTWAAAQDTGRSALTEYRYDAAGRLAGRTVFDAVDAQGNGVADTGASITTYVYDAQGLLRQQMTLRGADRSVQESVTYGYDGLGRLLSRTDAVDGSTTTYSYDDAQGTLRVSQANGHVHTEVRNSAGHLVAVTESATDVAPRTVRYFYDAEGQLRAVQNAGGAFTYTFYDAAGQVSGTVDATGAVVAYQRDAGGRMVSTTAYAQRINTAGWMDNGTGGLPAGLSAILPAPAPEDRTSYRVYDAAGLLSATVDAEGYVVTYAYDGAGHPVASTAYATALDSASRAALATTPDVTTLQAGLVASEQDRTQYSFYDVAGRVVATLDAAGYVSTIAYDGAGRALRTCTYATALDSAQLDLLGDTPALSAVLAAVSSSDDDAVSRTWYDAAGRAVASLDADGYLTVTTHDEADHTTITTRYAAPLTSDQRTTLTGHESPAALVALLPSQAGQTAVRQYDADGRLHQSTAVDGAVTVYAYDSASSQLTGTVTTPAEPGGQVRSTSAQVDGLGEVVQSTDGNHVTTTYRYNALGQRVLATDAQGDQVWYFYDLAGRLAYTVRGIADANGVPNALGEVAQLQYDAFGDVTGTTAFAARLDVVALGLDTTTSLSAIDEAVAAIADPEHDAHTAAVYDHRGAAVLQSDGDGYRVASAFDAFGELVARQNQLSEPGQALDANNSTTTTYTYDARGHVARTLEDAGGLARVTQASYDAFGRLQSTTDARDHVVSYTYEHDDQGRRVVLASQTVQGAVRTVETVYDAFERLVQRIDAMGAVTQYAYPDNHTTVVTTPDGVTLTTVRDAYGDVTTVTDATGRSTTYTYAFDTDGNGRLVTTTDALGHASTDHYNALGELDRHTDASGRAVSYTYDAAGRVLARTVDPDGLAQTTTYAYDGRGQQIKVTDATGAITTYSYDADGNVLSMVQDVDVGDAHALTSTTTWTWDGAGRQLTVTEGEGSTGARTTAYKYDHLGRRTQTIVDPQGEALATVYTYDGNDNLLAVTDPMGYITRYVYDEGNERIYTITSAYDPAVTSTPVGAVVQAFYDADGRVTATRTYATPIPLDGLTLAPGLDDVASLVTQASTDQRRYTVYDAGGRVHYTVDPQGYVTETTYDADGRVAETVAYAHLVSAQAFTNAGMWDKLVAGTADADMAALIIAAGNSEASAEATLNLYDADGRLTYVVRQDQVGGSRVGVVTGRTYDAAGQVLSETAYGKTLPLASGALAPQLTSESVAASLVGTPAHTTRYVYDTAGHRRYTVDAGNYVTEQRYDADGRVTGWVVYLNAIALPSVLDEARVASAVSAANDSSSTRTTTTDYDHAGRIREVADGAGTRSYTYNATGLKDSYTDRDGHTWNYTYDAAGRLETEIAPLTKVATFTTGNTLTTADVRLVTRYAYDDNGNVTSRTEADATTVARKIAYAYDSQNHQVRTTYPDAGSVDSAGVFHATGLGATTAVVTYDTLGHAVVNKDVRGKYQYKAYDVRGQVAFEVEDAGADDAHQVLYVTSYTYDAYGNVTGVSRYATPLDISKISGWAKGSPLSVSQISQGLAASTADRTLTTTYDLRNNKVQVQQSAITYVLAMGPGGGTADTGQPTTNYTYDAYGNLTSASVLMQDAYGAPGQANYSDAVWATTFSYYDVRNQKVKQVDPLGYETRWIYNGAGGVTTRVEYANRLDTSSLSTETVPGVPALGGGASGYDRWITYDYDSVGRKTSESLKGGFNYINGVASLVSASTLTTYTYYREDRVKTVTVNGATTTTVYDALGHVQSVTEPTRKALASGWQTSLKNDASLDLSDYSNTSLYADVAPVTTFTYDALGNAVRTVRSAGSVTQTTIDHYDNLGRKVLEVDATNTSYYFAYDAAGNVTKSWYNLTTNADSQLVTTTSTYDNVGQRLSTITVRDSHTDSAVYVKYNAFGEVAARGDGVKNGYSADGYEAVFSYNAAGQLTTAPASGTGAIHTYYYDLAGHLTFDGSDVSAAAGRTWTHYVLDPDGRATWIRPPSNTAVAGVNAAVETTYTYDRWGNVLTSTDGRGSLTTYLYDSQNHCILETQPEVLVVSATGVRSFQIPKRYWYYDLNGLLARTTDENSHSVSNTYDAVGHLTQVQDGTGAISYTAYDALGRAVAAQTPTIHTGSVAGADADVHITYNVYNGDDDIVQQGDFVLQSSGTPRTTVVLQTYVLDENGNRRRVTDALGYSTYAFDSQGRVLQSQTQEQADLGKSEVFTYDVNGNKTGETTANNDHQSWSYDYFGRVRSHHDLHNATYTYTYDPDSGLLNAQTCTWNPDNQGQDKPDYLTGVVGTASSIGYLYYANGRVKQVTEKIDSTVTNTTTYAYDGNGNVVDTVTTTSDGAGAGVALETLAEYDSHNRLSVVTQKNVTSGKGIVRTAYVYDAVGNRRAVYVQNGSNAGYTDIDMSGTAVTVGTVSNQTAQPGATYRFDASTFFHDKLGFGLTWSVAMADGSTWPSWLSRSGGVFSGTAPASGSWRFTLTVKDVEGNTATATFTLAVANVAPVLGTPANKTGTTNVTMASFQGPAATDANGDAITYSATGMPPGIVFNASTRTFSGAPTKAGTFTVSYKATDSKGLSTTKTFTITVQVATLPPVYHGGYTNKTGTIGKYLSIPMPTGAFTSPGGQAITYTAKVLIPQHQLTQLTSDPLMATAMTGSSSLKGTSFMASPSMLPTGDTITVPAQWVSISRVGLAISANGTISGTPKTLDYLTNEITDTYNHDLSYRIEVIATNSYGTATAQFTLSNSAGTSSMMATMSTSDDMAVAELDPEMSLQQESSDPGYSPELVADESLLDADAAEAQPVTDDSETGTTDAEMALSPMMLPPDDPDDPGTGGGSTGGGGTGGTGTTTPTSADIESYWFTYDEDNRVEISNGSLAGGSIVLTKDPTSYRLAYDAAGNATLRTILDTSGTALTQESFYNLRSQLTQANYSAASGTSRGVEELRSYDDAGHLRAIEQFYAAGTEIGGSNMPYYKRDPDLEAEGVYDGTPVGQKLASATIYQYDHNGHLKQQQNFGHAASWDGTGALATPPSTLPGVNATTWGGMTLQNQVTYKTEAGTVGSGYDAVGNVTDYQYYDATTGRTDFYHVDYMLKDGYLEKRTTSHSSDTNYQPATDTSYYDNFGNRIAILQHVEMASGSMADTGRAFAYDANGQILRRSDGTVSGGTYIPQGGAGMTYYAYVNGQQVANVDAGGGIHVLEGLTAFSNSETGTSGYVTQFGDSLKSIAQAQYGNASLWYVIAQANGLSSDEDLVPGQSLTIPQVTTSSNDATTFKPYNASEVSGSTTPPSVYAPPPPPPSSHHCNTLAMIVIIAVVIVAAVMTAGAAAAAMGATGAVTGAGASAAVVSGTAAVGGAAMTGGTLALGAGSFAAAIGSTATGMLAAAAGGFVGSIAGQVVGDAMGVSHGVSLKQALGSGLAASITAGLSGYVSGGSNLAALKEAGNYTAIAEMGAAGSVGGYLGNRFVHEPAHFSWANVAAAAISTTATAAMGVPTALETRWGTTEAGDYMAKVGGNLFDGAVESETARLLGGDAKNGRQIVEDAFGNTLANATMATINGYQHRQAHSAAGGGLTFDPGSKIPLARYWVEPDEDDYVETLSTVSVTADLKSDQALQDSLATYETISDPSLPRSAQPLPRRFDVTQKGFERNRDTIAEQIIYDKGWLNYGKSRQQAGDLKDPHSLQMLNALWKSMPYGRQLSVSEVLALNNATNEMGERNGFLFGPETPKTLETIQVTAPVPLGLPEVEIAAIDVKLIPVEIATANAGDNNTLAGGVTLLQYITSALPSWGDVNLVSNVTGGVTEIAEAFAKKGALNISWASNSSLFGSMVVSGNGNLPNGISPPRITSISLGSEAARDASISFNVGKYAPLLEKAGRFAGGAGIVSEWLSMDHDDSLDQGHFYLSAGLTLAGFAFEGLSPVGLAFGVADTLVSFYHYTPRYIGPIGEDQSGWRALYYNGDDVVVKHFLDAKSAIQAFPWQYGSGHGI
ncbi:putative Ig domain-containing protein [Frateuria sp. GZRe14]|uniref:putative Ig domain-containing protein n=1 Tax=Frateuria sp. GZRe14 TaxID=3351534 RepID=UPI003EDBABD5